MASRELSERLFDHRHHVLYRRIGGRRAGRGEDVVAISGPAAPSNGNVLADKVNHFSARTSAKDPHKLPHLHAYAELVDMLPLMADRNKEV